MLGSRCEHINPSCFVLSPVPRTSPQGKRVCSVCRDMQIIVDRLGVAGREGGGDREHYCVVYVLCTCNLV